MPHHAARPTTLEILMAQAVYSRLGLGTQKDSVMRE